jgi:hypothetical protein
MVGDDEHPPVVPGNVSELEAARAVSFMLHKALANLKKDQAGG